MLYINLFITQTVGKKTIIFYIPDQPGTLANITETLGQVNVNIDGFAGLTSKGKRDSKRGIELFRYSF